MYGFSSIVWCRTFFTIIPKKWWMLDVGVFPATSPVIDRSASIFLLSDLSRIVPSIVFGTLSLRTSTGRRCPIRCTRAWAWRSICGLKSVSYIMTVSADWRLSPTPPARVLSKKMKTSVPAKHTEPTMFGWAISDSLSCRFLLWGCNFYPTIVTGRYIPEAPILYS